MSEERFLKLKEVQNRLGVSRTTVWRWHVERGLRVVCIGAVTRIRESDLLDFLNRHLKGLPEASQPPKCCSPVCA